MISYINKHLLPLNQSGKHVLFWPEIVYGRDKKLKHPLYKLSESLEIYNCFKRQKEEYKLGSIATGRLDLYNHLSIGVCMTGKHTLSLSHFLTCLKKTVNYTRAIWGELHISTYPLYFLENTSWNYEIYPTIRVICQGLTVYIHTERLRTKEEGENGVQANTSLFRLPV